MTRSDSNKTQWDPDQYAEHARFVSELGAPVLEYLAAKPGERILDLGCGDGTLTSQLKELGCAVVGVDASPEMVAAARTRGIEARVMPGEALIYEDRFEAVFSNAALHWMKDPEAVIQGVWRALIPGGRFVAEFGGHGNIAAIMKALNAALRRRGLEVEQPWYFPHADEYGERLQTGGFDVQEIRLFPRPTHLPSDIAGWLDTFAQPYTNSLSPEDKEIFIAEVVDELRPTLCDAKGQWTADYVRIRFFARKRKL